MPNEFNNTKNKEVTGKSSVAKKDTHVSCEDMFYKYIHDIRNMRKLNSEMLNNINNMSNAEKMEIIVTFNDVVEGLIYLIDDDNH